MEQQKRGQASLQGMPVTILFLIIAVITLVLSLVIVQEIRDTDTLSIGSSTNFVNETLTSVEDVTGEAIAGNAAPNCQMSVGTVANSTGTETLTVGNFTVTGCTIFSTSTSLGWNNTDWNVSGSYTQGDEAYRATNESLVGLATFGDFISIIVLSVIAGIVLAIIFGLFGSRRRSR